MMKLGEIKCNKSDFPVGSKFCTNCLNNECIGYKLATENTIKFDPNPYAIRAVIDGCFSETKEEIRERAYHLIMELIKK